MLSDRLTLHTRVPPFKPVVNITLRYFDDLFYNFWVNIRTQAVLSTQYKYEMAIDQFKIIGCLK